MKNNKSEVGLATLLEGVGFLIFIKVNSKEVSMGGIALLQETHIKDEKLIKLYWKMNYATYCVSTQSLGVILLNSIRLLLVQRYDNEMVVKLF